MAYNYLFYVSWYKIYTNRRDSMNIVGHHHISMYTKDAKRNKDFYTNVLGLRLVEKSVNQDNPSMYHLFYGDEVGTAGTILSFFEIPNAGHKQPGTETIYRFSLLVPNQAALHYFEKRLDNNGITSERLYYLGQEGVVFKDEDDLEIILLVNDSFEVPHQWQHNVYSEIPQAYQILGIGPVELRVRNAARTVEFLENVLGYRKRDNKSFDVLTLAPQGLYSDFVVIEQQGQRERPGRGYIHHIAINTPQMSDLDAIYKKLQQQTQSNSGIIDRYFFKSLYYRHNSIMYEFATEAPGFTIDTPLEFGLYSLGDHLLNPLKGEKVSYEQRINEIIEASKLADEAGIDVFAVGESHQEHFTTQAPTVVLGAIAQATKHIKVSSSSTIISATDPVRVFEDFATLDLISHGRAEIVAGRASRTGIFDLFGYDLKDYDELFEEKLGLLLELNKTERITWSGKYRPELRNMKIFPRPIDNTLPIWRAVGGPPASAIKAGKQGVPMMITTLGGPAMNFKGSIDAYRQAATEAGFDASPKSLPVSIASLFYTAETTQDAMREFYPHLNTGMSFIRGVGYPKQQFANSPDYREALMVGSPQQIIEKILYQHELYGHQRFMAQLDFGGVPFENVMKNIELIGNDIIPAIKKHLSK